MFEQEYKRANDRIHPRKDLLKEMEAKWAAEQAQPAEEKGKVVAFPAWAKYAAMAAGVLLCVGIGMGSMLLLGRSRGMQKSAAADAPMMAQGMTVEAQEEEAAIVTESKADMAMADDAPAAMLAAPAAAAPRGMHPAADEAEVEDAVRWGDVDRGETPLEANDAAPETEAKAAAKAEASDETARYPAGACFQRDDLLALFLPTAEQVHVVQYADRKVTNVFSLGLREKGAQVKQVFWMDNELLALRERGGDTELLRTDVTDWKSPRHLGTMTQSGTFLAAAEMNGRVYILSLYTATEEEPRPWVDDERIDFTEVFLDSDRPGTVFTVLTVYDPRQGDGFVARMALLAEAKGAVIEADRLLLWAGTEETDLYVLSADETGLVLQTQGTRPGTVLDAELVGEDFSLLLQTGDDVELLTLDRALNEKNSVVVSGAGAVRWGQVYEEGALCLTAEALHWITAEGDRPLDVTGDGFCWLAPDRGLVMTEDGKLQLLAFGENGPEAQGTLKIWDSLAALIEDPSRIAFDLDKGRLVFPAGKKVYQYLINDKGQFVARGTPATFNDHNEAEQRELRCLLTEDRILLFNKAGVVLCNMNLERLVTNKY